MKQIIERVQQTKVYELLSLTPLEAAPKLSAQLNNTITIKREDLQPVFSFKCRGAYNKIANLSPEQQQQGVITASAGNHAQGVALACQKLKLNATIVIPQTTPSIKVDKVRSYGANAVLVGDSYDDAHAHAMKLVSETGMTFIHPFDDDDVIAGQATIATEIMDQHDGMPDYIFVAVGGGGLIAGITAVIKTQYPQVKIIGVEPEDSNCLTQALAANERVVLDRVGIFADGVAVKQIGKRPFEIVNGQIDAMVCVSTDEICAGIKDIFDETRSIVEPAGALSIAGAKKYISRHNLTDKKIVTINCGANTNFDRLRHIAERAEIGELKEALFAVTIPEEPGSFKTFCQLLGKETVTEFNYRYADSKNAHIFVGVGLQGGDAQQRAIFDRLSAHFDVIDLTDNELAKLHVRHMVGGKTEMITDERLLRFQFPERPGALLEFLNSLGQNWNISLFHYRNHGAAYGRVLAGLQVPEQDLKKLTVALDELGYWYQDETDNPAFNLFL